MEHHDALSCCLGIAAVLSLLIMACAPIGYADVTYSATTTNAGNSVSAQYFTVGLYKKVNDTYSPVASDSLLSEPIYKDSSNKVSGNCVLSASDLYVKVSNDCASGFAFSLSEPTFSLTDNGSPIGGMTYTLKVGTSTYTSTSSSWSSSAISPNSTTRYRSRWTSPPRTRSSRPAIPSRDSST